MPVDNILWPSCVEAMEYVDDHQLVSDTGLVAGIGEVLLQGYWQSVVVKQHSTVRPEMKDGTLLAA